VIVLLTRHDEDVRGGVAEPSLERVAVLRLRERLYRLRIVDDEQPQPLAVAGVRAAARRARDPLERLARHTLAGVAANGAALLQ
jgi:hypothetical protein